MAANILIPSAPVVALSSPELMHTHCLAKASKVHKRRVIQPNGTYVHSQGGQAYPCCHFAKRKACPMVTRYSFDLWTKGFEPVAALESDATQSAILRIYSEALHFAADQAGKPGVQQAYWAIPTSKANALARIANAGERRKILSAANRLFSWLFAKDWVHLCVASACCLAYRPNLKTGARHHKGTAMACSDSKDKVVEPVLMTARGWTKLQEGAAK